MSIAVIFWLSLAVALLCIVFTVLGAAALQPKTGTLEWIALYDKPALNPFGALCRFTGKDAAVLFAALAAATLAGGLWRSSSWQAPALLGVQALGLYALAAISFGAPLASFTAALCVVFSTVAFGGPGLTSALLPWALLLLSAWMCTDPGHGLRRCLLLGGSILLGLAAWLDAPGALWLLPVWLLVICFTLTLRFRAAERGTLRTALLSLLWTAAAVPALLLVRDWLAGISPAQALQRTFWQALPARLWLPVCGAWQPDALLSRMHPLLTPAAIAAVFCILWCAADLFRQRHVTALPALAVCILVWPAWLLGGCQLAALALGCGLGCGLRSLLVRGKKMPAIPAGIFAAAILAGYAAWLTYGF